MGRPANDNNPEGEQFRKLFIGGLDYRTTDQSLKSFYEQWGEIVDVVVMKHPQTQKSRGFGFVTYASSTMVDEAMKNRPHNIDGRKVDSKRAVPRDASGASNNVNVMKMFVGGLKEQTDQEIKDYFNQFGNIVGVNVVMDKTTGKRKGYAFIEFDDYDPVDKALLVKDHQVAGKSVTVKKAVVKDGQGGGAGGSGGMGGGPRGNRGPPGGRGGGGGGGGGGARVGPPQWQGTAAPGPWGAAPNGGYRSTPGPWDPSANGWNSGWGGDQYGNAWNGASTGYEQNYGGGPVRSNYNPGQRNAPYGM
uniref:HnRNP n=1 Tax=Corythucha ciliata TaxID=369451 RepID=A0A1Z1JN52_CORCT|nr:hnRNP [Corythucha ciliata]